MGTESTETTTSVEETHKNQAAYEGMLPHYRSIAEENVRAPCTNLRQAAITALGVAEKINQPSWRAVYSKLAPELLEPTTLDLLEPAARGLMFVCTQAVTAEVITSETMLPAAMVVEASELRSRMLKLATYHLGENQDQRALIEDIKAGKGYSDLAEDLSRLALLYRANLDLISKDPSHYVAEDPDRAEALAERIESMLGTATAPKQKAQKELVSRAWTFLYDTYEKIAKPGRWLFDGKGAEVFVSLVGAGRRSRRNTKKQDAPGQTA